MTIRYGEKGSTLSFQAQSAIFHCTAPITVAGVEPFHATFTRSELATGGGRGRGVVSVSRGPRGPMRVNNPVVPTLHSSRATSGERPGFGFSERTRAGCSGGRCSRDGAAAVLRQYTGPCRDVRMSTLWSRDPRRHAGLASESRRGCLGIDAIAAPRP